MAVKLWLVFLVVGVAVGASRERTAPLVLSPASPHTTRITTKNKVPGSVHPVFHKEHSAGGLKPATAARGKEGARVGAMAAAATTTTDLSSASASASEVSKSTAIPLALFTSWTGLSDVYMGNTQVALLKWLSFVLGLVVAAAAALISGLLYNRFDLLQADARDGEDDGAPAKSRQAFDPHVGVAFGTYIFTTYFTFWVFGMIVWTVVDVARIATGTYS